MSTKDNTAVDSTEEMTEENTAKKKSTKKESTEVKADSVTEKAETVSETTTEVTDRFVYIGPTVTRTKLRESMIMRGSRDSAEAYLKDEIEKFPDVKNLIIPIAELAKKSEQVKKKGTQLNKYYNAVLEAAAK